MSNKYPGLSLFPSFRAGNFNWLDNHDRPFFNLSWTTKKGKIRYQDVFLNIANKDGVKNPSLDVSETKTHVVLKIAKKPGQPIARVSGKDMFAS